MANTLDILRDRLRAAGTVGISDALGYQLVDLCQKMVNARIGSFVKTSSYNWPANTSHAAVSTISSNAMRILSLKQGDRTLHRLPHWQELNFYDSDWYKKTGTRFEVWAPMGHDLILIYPAIASQTSITAYYAAYTTTIDDATDDLEIHDTQGFVDLMYDFVELIANAHLRNFRESRQRMADIVESLRIGFPRSDVDFKTMEGIVNEQNDPHQFSGVAGPQ